MARSPCINYTPPLFPPSGAVLRHRARFDDSKFGSRSNSHSKRDRKRHGGRSQRTLADSFDVWPTSTVATFGPDARARCARGENFAAWRLKRARRREDFSFFFPFALDRTIGPRARTSIRAGVLGATSRRTCVLVRETRRQERRELSPAGIAVPPITSRMKFAH